MQCRHNLFDQCLGGKQRYFPMSRVDLSPVITNRQENGTMSRHRSLCYCASRGIPLLRKQEFFRAICFTRRQCALPRYGSHRRAVACVERDRSANHDGDFRREAHPFAHSREDWDETDREESRKLIPEDVLSNFRAEFDSSDEVDKAQLKSNEYDSSVRQRETVKPMRPPSPFTPIAIIRFFVRFAVHFVNNAIIPTLYVLSLAWHDFKLRMTAPSPRAGESPFFLPSPRRTNRATFKSAAYGQDWSKDHARTDTTWRNREISTEEQQAELIQNAAIQAANSVHSTAESAWGILTDAFDMFRNDLKRDE